MISLQRAYTSQLHGYIVQLGIFSIRHLKLCLPILLSKLEYPDKDMRKDSLHALLALICWTWPRISFHKMPIETALLKLVHSEADEAVLCLARKCLTLL